MCRLMSLKYQISMNSEYSLMLQRLSLKKDTHKNDSNLLPRLNFVKPHVPKLVVPKFDKLDRVKKSNHENQIFKDDNEGNDHVLYSTDDTDTNLYEHSEQKVHLEKEWTFREEELSDSASHYDRDEIFDHKQNHYQSLKLSKNISLPNEHNVLNTNLQLSNDDNFTNNFKNQNSPFSSSSNESADTRSPDNDSTGLPSEIAQQIIVKYSGLRDIAGLEDVKQSLREAIIYPIRYPHLFKNGRSAWSRALLFGAPGVGKTSLAHAAAAEAKLPLYQVSSSDLTSAWYGHTEKLIRRLFETLGRRHCILLLDEIDGFCRKRNSDDSAHCRRAATELLIQMQHYEGSEMFLLCATNRPWEIDPAFLRRFQQRIFVPLPEIEARERILLENMGNSHNIVPGEAWSKFIKATEGLTGSDLKNITRSALMLPLREMQRTTHWIETISGRMIPADKSNSAAVHCSIENIPDHKVDCRELEIDDLWNALEKADRTVTKNCLDPFKTFMKEHAIK